MTDFAPDACASFFSSLTRHYADVGTRLGAKQAPKRPNRPTPPKPARSSAPKKNAEVIVFGVTQPLLSQFIIAHVATYYGRSPSELSLKTKLARITWPRHIASFLIREMTGRSLPSIAKLFGGRHHTTIRHGILRIESEAEANQALAADLDELRRRIRGRIEPSKRKASERCPPMTLSNTFWTMEREAQLRRLWRENMRLEQIASKFGKSPATVWWKAELLGLKRRTRKWNAKKHSSGRKSVSLAYASYGI